MKKILLVLGLVLIFGCTSDVVEENVLSNKVVQGEEAFGDIIDDFEDKEVEVFKKINDEIVAENLELKNEIADLKVEKEKLDSLLKEHDLANKIVIDKLNQKIGDLEVVVENNGGSDKKYIEEKGAFLLKIQALEDEVDRLDKSNKKCGEDLEKIFKSVLMWRMKCKSQ